MTSCNRLNNPFSPMDFKKVKNINFGILSSRDLQRMSVTEGGIDQEETYDKSASGGANKVPKANGINDKRMGSLEKGEVCDTCMMTSVDCPGHLGHINLESACYHPGFLNIVLKVLRCVCFSCSRLLLGNDEALRGKLRSVRGLRRKKLDKCLDLCKTRKLCGGEVVEGEDGEAPEGALTGCGATQPKFLKDSANGGITVEEQDEDAMADEEEGKDMKRFLYAEQAFNVLTKIRDDDMVLMGFDPNHSRPDSLLIKVLPVPPPAVRPSVKFGTDRSEDDLTLKLLDIVKVNNNIRKRKRDGAPGHVVEDYAKLLQYHICTLVDNTSPGLPRATTRNKKPLKTLRSRLKSKEGRLRGNLMGKRVDFSARTVITGDANLDLDQVGVPRSIAMTLTYPEVVTPLNIGRMRELVRNGPDNYPGAMCVIREDGTRFDLRFVSGEVPLEYGYTVERHMKDDDFVLFNRQPSLHKMSIMGHRVKVLPYSTFRLNLSVTPPYNADFDGDEMNLHLAQSPETRAEIAHIMGVPRQMVSPQGNKPVMGLVQDSLLAVAKFTKRNTFLTKEMVMNILLHIPHWNGEMPDPCIISPMELWTGKQIFTLLLRGSNRRISLIKAGIRSDKNDHPVIAESDGK
eukprot:Cvel_26433.t1-p1 / transcript=Cvel_26433.t1 / gene=Cvel_26433 / organism=Chromera_velia_CCMP2878 / gene_product=DNA-directed RNA polymerase II subunit rpb1, putative / transcript_product=DNA-directed RNA polymerase II subunit rpb1, putative / location=Cvel_scaffold3139:11384-19037(+) / protein_length=627 / sequence_SO=supercontig / SO=protein_coding / is_pseudo=false